MLFGADVRLFRLGVCWCCRIGELRAELLSKASEAELATKAGALQISTHVPWRLERRCCVGIKCCGFTRIACRKRFESVEREDRFEEIRSRINQHRRSSF